MNIQNLQTLYEVGLKILADRRPFGFGSWWPIAVNFDRPECGTFCCFAGYYLIETERNDLSYGYNGLAEHFGITRDESKQLFRSCYEDGDLEGDEPGPEAYAELERRMEYLAGLIREAGGTVPHSTKTHDHIPESVRAIFAERVT